MDYMNIMSTYDMQGSSGDELDSSHRRSPSPNIPLSLEMIPINNRDDYMDRIKVRSTEQLLSEIAKIPTHELDVQSGGVYAKALLPRGKRFGPYPVTWTKDPTDKFAWEVEAGSSFHGWLEPTHDWAKWPKKIRTVYKSGAANIRNFLVAGFMYLEVVRDIQAGAELLATPKVPIQIFKGSQDDRSDRETGSQHSGTGEDDFNSNDLENSGKHHSQDQSDKEQGDATDDEEGIDCKCVVCDRQCQDIDQLDDHLITAHHYPKDAFRCEVCPKSYCYRPSLLRHRALVHGELRKYPCENCNKVHHHDGDDNLTNQCEERNRVFTDPSNLQRHIRTHHVGARSHACAECGKTFATSSGLKQHTHIHSSVKPFQCEVCFKAYTQFSNLCRHKRMHADCRMQIKCSKCGQSFSTVTSLSKHKRFCDSTNCSPSSHHTALPSSAHHQQLQQQQQQQPQQQQQQQQQPHPPLQPSGIPQIPQAMSTPPNPFLMFRGPPPFHFPPGFGAYHGLHNMFPTSPAHAPAFPMLFPPTNLDMSGGSGTTLDKDRCTPPSSRHHQQQSRQHHQPPPHYHQIQASHKVSPSAAEEASSHLRPSPARPIPINPHRLQHQHQHHPPQTAPIAPAANNNNNDSRGCLLDSHSIKRSHSDEDRDDAEPRKRHCELEVKRSNDAHSTFNNGSTGCLLESSHLNKRQHSEDRDVRKLSNTTRPSFVSIDDFSLKHRRRSEDPEDIKPAIMKPRHHGSDETKISLMVGNNNASPVHTFDTRKSFKRRHSEEPDESAPRKRNYNDDMKSNGHCSPVTITAAAEQPLDLTISKKALRPRSLSPEPIKAEPLQTYNESRSSPSLSPVPTTSPSPPGPTMAYPRPIHPMLLEAIYRPNASLGGGAFQRPFPFLGPMCRPGGTFDMLSRSHPTFSSKPFHEALMAAGGIGSASGHHAGSVASHMGVGKLKDRYACKYCGKVFPRSANLTRHLRTHTGEQPYKCKYCERSFSISSNLQRHVRNIHNKERPFKCHLCERCFGQQTNLDRHLKKHEADASGLGLGVGDSPSSNEADREESCYDEFRSFFGKVTYAAEGMYTPTSVATTGDIETEDGVSDVDTEIHIDKEPLSNIRKLTNVGNAVGTSDMALNFTSFQNRAE